MVDDGKSSVSFAVSEGPTSSAGPKSKEFKRRRSSRGSFFSKKRMSFARSGGERGADIDTLRGTTGADFEARASVTRGPGGSSCGCFGGNSALKERILLIKGPFCFVFSSEEDLAPKYAVSLAHLKPVTRGVNAGKHIVALETSLGDAEYEFGFGPESDAKEFVKVAKEQASKGEADIVRKRLGHAHLLNKRSSVRYAENVALKKIESQPEKPEALTVDDVVGAGGAFPGAGY